MLKVLWYLWVAIRELVILVLFLLLLPMFLVIGKLNKEFSYNMKAYVDNKIKLLENVIESVESP